MKKRLLFVVGIIIGSYALLVLAPTVPSVVPIFPDEIFRIYETTDADRVLDFEVGAISDATTRTLTVRDASGTILMSGDTLTGDATATFDTDGSTVADINESVLEVGGSDTIFPADPGADKFLMWDDAPTGELSFVDCFKFTTIQTATGTSPVADSLNDTLTLSEASAIELAGNAAGDSVTIGLRFLTDQLSVDGSNRLYIIDDAITEALLKAVNSPVDEDILTYESTTGDFEWHTLVELGGGGTLTGDGTASRIPYYTGTTVLGNEAAFSYTSSTNTLYVDNIDTDDIRLWGDLTLTDGDTIGWTWSGLIRSSITANNSGGDLTLAADDQIFLDAAGTIPLRPSGDTGDYFDFKTLSSVPTIGTVGNCNLALAPDTGVTNVTGQLHVSSSITEFGDAVYSASESCTGELDGTWGSVEIKDNIIDEANLKLDTGPTNDYVLTADSTKSGGMKWADVWTEAENTAAAYIPHSLADAANDFLVASGDDTFVKKTLAETGAILEADIDHGNLQGLTTGDPHTQYLELDGSDTMTGKHIVRSTGQQLELEYDGSNQADFIVTSGGELTIKSNSSIKFNMKDADQYIWFDVLANRPYINSAGGGLTIKPSTGYLDIAAGIGYDVEMVVEGDVAAEGGDNWFVAAADRAAIPSALTGGAWDTVIGYHTNAGLRLANSAASSSSTGAGLILYSFDGAMIGNGHRLGFALFGGSTGANTYAHTAGLSSYATEAWSSGNYGSNFVFQTTANGSSSRATVLELTDEIKGLPVYSDSHGGTGRAMYVQSDGQFTCDTSARKYKENIRDLTDSAWIYDLRPRIANWKKSNIKDDVCLIADEVEAVNSKMVTYEMNIVYEDVNDGLGLVKTIKSMTETDIPESVHYNKLIIPMLHQMQIMKIEIDNLRVRAAELEKVR